MSIKYWFLLHQSIYTSNKHRWNVQYAKSALFATVSCVVDETAQLQCEWCKSISGSSKGTVAVKETFSSINKIAVSYIKPCKILSGAKNVRQNYVLSLPLKEWKVIFPVMETFKICNNYILCIYITFQFIYLVNIRLCFQNVTIHL